MTFESYELHYFNAFYKDHFSIEDPPKKVRIKVNFSSDCILFNFLFNLHFISSGIIKLILFVKKKNNNNRYIQKFCFVTFYLDIKKKFKVYKC